MHVNQLLYAMLLSQQIRYEVIRFYVLMSTMCNKLAQMTDITRSTNITWLLFE